MDNSDPNSYVRSTYYAQFDTGFFIDNFDRIHSFLNIYLEIDNPTQNVVDFAKYVKTEINKR